MLGSRHFNDIRIRVLPIVLTPLLALPYLGFEDATIVTVLSGASLIFLAALRLWLSLALTFIVSLYLGVIGGPTYIAYTCIFLVVLGLIIINNRVVDADDIVKTLLALGYSLLVAVYWWVIVAGAGASDLPPEVSMFLSKPAGSTLAGLILVYLALSPMLAYGGSLRVAPPRIPGRLSKPGASLWFFTGFIIVSAAYVNPGLLAIIMLAVVIWLFLSLNVKKANRLLLFTITLAVVLLLTGSWGEFNETLKTLELRLTGGG
ncbi:MAG: hypothetical protein P3X22_006265 [Thermoprotei archaeon]|nr:hypothetical protein [Thermoprotei archaeon]